MTYQIAAIPMTLSDFQGHSFHLLQAFLSGIFCIFVQQFTRFQLTWGIALSLSDSLACCTLHILYVHYDCVGYEEIWRTEPTTAEVSVASVPQLCELTIVCDT